MITKEQLLEILDYAKKNGVTEEEAKKHYGITLCGSLIYYKKKYGVEWKKPITKEKVEEIINYSLEHKIPEKEVCKMYGIYPKSLSQMKKRLGIKPNPIGNAPFTARGKVLYKINDDFFETPNLLNCYYAGFFAADGCVQQGQRICTVALSSKDKEWLSDFAKHLDYEGPLYEGVAKKKFGFNILRFNSEKIVKDLNKNFNITPRKSLTLLPPNLTDENLIDAFICGYIDGDGCIVLYENKKKQKTISFNVLGTLEMCQWIKQRICNIMGREIGCITHKTEHKGNTYSFSFSNKIARQIFLKYYNIDVPKLERKWSKEKYEFCLNYKKKLPISRRKGVNIFDLSGKFIKHCETLNEAQEFTGVNYGRISNLCKRNSNHFMTNGFMFSRDEKMMPFEPTCELNKHLMQKYI